jgi:hypothetical protein
MACEPGGFGGNTALEPFVETSAPASSGLCVSVTPLTL